MAPFSLNPLCGRKGSVFRKKASWHVHIVNSGNISDLCLLFKKSAYLSYVLEIESFIWENQWGMVEDYWKSYIWTVPFAFSLEVLFFSLFMSEQQQFQKNAVEVHCVFLQDQMPWFMRCQNAGNIFIVLRTFLLNLVFSRWVLHSNYKTGIIKTWPVSESCCILFPIHYILPLSVFRENVWGFVCNVL